MVAPRKPRADGERTREAIVRGAVALAAVDGLEGLTIGNLATSLRMSKSGVYAHFGSKQELQLATVAEAERIFRLEVIEPAEAAAEGLPRLVALCEGFLDHLERTTFPGGCFFAGAVLELCTRPGPVNDEVVAFQTRFNGLIYVNVAAALARKELASTENPERLTFELCGVFLAANAAFVIQRDPSVLHLARTIVRTRLGA